jgi:hypothetical protein
LPSSSPSQTLVKHSHSVLLVLQQIILLPKLLRSLLVSLRSKLSRLKLPQLKTGTNPNLKLKLMVIVKPLNLVNGNPSLLPIKATHPWVKNQLTPITNWKTKMLVLTYGSCLLI